MAQLDYSVDAKNVLASFYRAGSVVYVEGDDDVPFWRALFEAYCPSFSVEVLSVGGASQLDLTINQIINDNLAAIAARDKDYLDILGKTSQHPRVLYTFGHSIENSLFSPSALSKLIEAYCRTTRVPPSQCGARMFALGASMRELIVLDVANEHANTGTKVLGNDCSKFMKTTTSDEVCPIQVTKECVACSPAIPTTSIDFSRQKLSLTKDIHRHIRGHFLASWARKHVLRLARSAGRKPSVSNDAFLAHAMTLFSAEIKTTHPHRSHYGKSVRKASRAAIKARSNVFAARVLIGDRQPNTPVDR